ncbi:g1010 [Coccomyxa viridis]|uniref:G1010 protein n=1 Tax=Coccomyxa viridis TaxID=1274662 RepID=A0ABP1FH14_9CHLO
MVVPPYANGGSNDRNEYSREYFASVGPDKQRDNQDPKALKAQDMALRRLNVIKNGIDEPDKTILVGCTDRNNLHTRIGFIFMETFVPFEVNEIEDLVEVFLPLVKAKQGVEGVNGMHPPFAVAAEDYSRTKPGQAAASTSSHAPSSAPTTVGIISDVGVWEPRRQGLLGTLYSIYQLGLPIAALIVVGLGMREGSQSSTC